MFSIRSLADIRQRHKTQQQRFANNQFEIDVGLRLSEQSSRVLLLYLQYRSACQRALLRDKLQ